MNYGILKGVKVIVHVHTMGTTEPALMTLRNEVASRMANMLTVCQVPAKDDTNCYGFIIFDHTLLTAVVIGDGFRSDGEGTGGAGHRAAQAFLAVMGIHPVILDEDEAVKFTSGVTPYAAAIDVARIYEPQVSVKAHIPGYVDTVLLHMTAVTPANRGLNEK